MRFLVNFVRQPGDFTWEQAMDKHEMMLFHLSGLTCYGDDLFN